MLSGGRPVRGRAATNNSDTTPPKSGENIWLEYCYKSQSQIPQKSVEYNANISFDFDFMVLQGYFTPDMIQSANIGSYGTESEKEKKKWRERLQLHLKTAEPS